MLQNLVKHLEYIHGNQNISVKLLIDIFLSPSKHNSKKKYRQLHLKPVQFLISLDKRQFYHFINYNLLLLNTIIILVYILLLYIYYLKSL